MLDIEDVRRIMAGRPPTIPIGKKLRFNKTWEQLPQEQVCAYDQDPGQSLNPGSSPQSNTIEHAADHSRNTLLKRPAEEDLKKVSTYVLSQIDHKEANASTSTEGTPTHTHGVRELKRIQVGDLLIDHGSDEDDVPVSASGRSFPDKATLRPFVATDSGDDKIIAVSSLIRLSETWTTSVSNSESSD